MISCHTDDKGKKSPAGSDNPRRGELCGLTCAPKGDYEGWLEFPPCVIRIVDYSSSADTDAELSISMRKGTSNSLRLY